MKDYLEGGGEIGKMGSAEQFAWEFGAVPQLTERLNCFQYLVDFEPKRVDILPDISTLEKSSNFVATSDKISKFLEVVLHVGNFLNADNRRLGQALGFKLETLSKLSDTKTADNKRTIFEVIVEMIMDSKPSVLEFSKADIELLSAAARVSLSTLEPELKKLSKQFEVVSGVAPTISKCDPEDKFQEVFKKFSEKAQADLQTMNKAFESAVQRYNQVVTLFAEDPSKMGPEEFFVIWQTLVQKIVETTEKITQNREKEEKLKKREEAKAKRETPAGLSPSALPVG
eukprot:TRINITY_DN10643_c0_g1_i9.p1 TRINITY_DN10643_c0_g1~~TRINITY_DN10643_c0_g1_i9.p1  ORF type:complete len:285 (-),score=87.43 TRINITY_DN10643_c0_g1_i9:360-1214(-)